MAIWSVPFLPTHDGPKTLYASHVWSHAGEPGYAAEFRRGAPVTNLGFAFLYSGLERLASWHVAYALVWTFVVLLVPFAVWRLACAFDVRRSPVALIAVAAAFHWSIHMGFVNYAGSLGLGLLAVACGIERQRWSVRREIGIYGLVLLATLFHPVGAQVAAIGLFTFRLLTLRRGRLVRDLGATVLGCAPAAAVSLVSRDALLDARSKGLIGGETWRLTWLETLASPTRVFLSGPAWRSLPVLLFAMAGLVLAVRALVRRQFDARSVTLLVLVLLGVFASAIAPMQAGGWEAIQPRFIPIAVFCALALLPFERLTGRIRVISTAALFGFGVASNLWVLSLHRDFEGKNREALAGLHRDVIPGRTLLPILARPDSVRPPRDDTSLPVAHALFMLNIGQVYGVERDAIVPYTFSLLPEIHLIENKLERLHRVPRRDYGAYFAEGADPIRRRAELIRLASYGLAFDDVLFIGAADDADAFIATGYEVEVRDGGFMIGHFEGCPIHLKVRGSRPGDALYVGWLHADRVVEIVVPTETDDEERLIARGSCSGMWVRAATDSGKQPRCRGGRADGAAESAAGSEVLECVIER